MTTSISKKLLVAAFTFSTVACSQLDAMKRLRDFSLEEEPVKKKKRFGDYRDRKESSESSSDESPANIEIIIVNNSSNDVAKIEIIDCKGIEIEIEELAKNIETLSMDVEVVNNQQVRPQLTPQEMQQAAQQIKSVKNWAVRQWNKFLG